MKPTSFLSASAPLLVAAAAVLAVGDLNPPPGAIAATGKSLTELEPRIAINATNTPGNLNSVFRISQPGSYYLTGNLTGVSGKSGIEIAANNVVLDLNGYTLQGVSGSLSGVSVQLAADALTIRDGVVANWGFEGVFQSATCTGALIENVQAIGCSSHGFALAGEATVLSKCNSVSNLGDGFNMGVGCVLTNCTSYSNNGNGIVLSSIGTISDCTVRSNGGHGIRAESNGFAHIANCVVVDNTLDGIRVRIGCMVLNNSCAFNGAGVGSGSNIHVLGSNNRIEGNQCLNADIGVDVDLAGNTILRNTCADNVTNWDIVPNNIYGPIVDRRVPASAAVLGNSAASSLGTTDANANFSY